MPIEISIRTARRFILGRQGLWPGRRHRGLDGAAQAIREMGELQLDPLVLVARAQDLMLHARVIDYPADGWATLTYERRRFFDWGGWLAIRPIEELPHWRVLMRRERSKPYWRQVVADALGAGMRRLLGFLETHRIDVAAIRQPRLRRAVRPGRART